MQNWYHDIVSFALKHFEYSVSDLRTTCYDIQDFYYALSLNQEKTLVIATLKIVTHNRDRSKMLHKVYSECSVSLSHKFSLMILYELIHYINTGNLSSLLNRLIKF